MKRRSLTTADIEVVQEQVARKLAATRKPGWNPEPDKVQRSVVKLVLTLVEFLRQLMERQALRRMDEGTLTDEETEAVGTALMKLEETVLELADQFGIPRDELNLELGPLGRLI